MRSLMASTMGTFLSHATVLARSAARRCLWIYTDYETDALHVALVSLDSHSTHTHTHT
jgi:hypothetical protein